MATQNNDKIASAENSLNRAKRLIQEVIESDRGLHTKTQQRCYNLAREAYELHEMLAQLVKVQTVAEEDEFDYSELSADYTPKTIISTYSHTLRDCTDVNYGVLQVGMCASFLAEWFKIRFVPEVRNPKFKYKADRIAYWIDLIILSFGIYMSRDELADFEAQFNDYLEQIQTDFNQTWPLPYFISSIDGTMYSQDYTPEAILLERMLKPKIYSNKFYFNMMHTVEDTVKQYRPDLKSLSMDTLIKLPSVTTTSSFDIRNYA